LQVVAAVVAKIQAAVVVQVVIVTARVLRLAVHSP
jgi:hypothetical protein